MLAERTGLEPATSDVTGRHSNQLNYHSEKYTFAALLEGTIKMPSNSFR